MEINPLILTDAGEVVALDAKIDIDENAAFRQKELQSGTMPASWILR